MVSDAAVQKVATNVWAKIVLTYGVPALVTIVGVMGYFIGTSILEEVRSVPPKIETLQKQFTRKTDALQESMNRVTVQQGVVVERVENTNKRIDRLETTLSK